MSRSKSKLAILTNSLAPYRIPFFQELGERLSLTVMCEQIINDQRSWELDGMEYSFTLKEVRSIDIPYLYKGAEGSFRELRKLSISTGVYSSLCRTKPDVVVSLEMGVRTLLAILWCKLNKKKLLLWWEGTIHTERGVSWIKRRLRSFIVKRVDGAWSNGIESTEYLMRLGLAENAISNGMTGVDTDFFVKKGKEWHLKRDQVRKDLNLGGKVMAFSGRLTPLKGIKELLAGIEIYTSRKNCEEINLLFIGEGEERSRIEAWAELHPSVRVHITGFLQLDQLPKYYAAADVYCLPTLHDNWALATLEPLLSGLPSLISVYNGAGSDLVDSEAGIIIFDPNKPEDFSEKLISLLDVPMLSDEKINSLSVYYSARSMAERAEVSLSTIVSV